MMIVNIAALVVAFAVVALVVTLIPLIRELKRSAEAIRETTSRLEAEVHQTLQQLNKTMVEVNILTSGAAEKVDDVKEFMSAIGDTGRGLRTISSVVGGAAQAFSKSSLWLAGAKVAGSFVMDKLVKKRGI